MTLLDDDDDDDDDDYYYYYYYYYYDYDDNDVDDDGDGGDDDDDDDDDDAKLYNLGDTHLLWTYEYFRQVGKNIPITNLFGLCYICATFHY